MGSGWSVRFHETSTGDYLSGAQAVTGTWGTSITSPGSGSHTFRLDDGQHTRDEWRFLTSHWSKTLVHCWNDWPIYAGLVYRREATANLLTVAHGELRNLFARRLPFAVGDPAGAVFNPTGSVVVSNQSFPSAVRQVVQTASLGAGFELPIIYPEPGAGGYSNEWKFYAFPTVEDMLADIEKTDNGPDIHFTPEYDGESLRWVLRVGAPRLTAAPYEWNVSAEGSVAVDVKFIEDGAKMLTGVFAVGAGAEQDMRVGGARNVTGPDIPFMDSSRAYKTESDKNRLNDFALAELKTFRTPTVQTEFSARASQTENLSNIIPGSRLGLHFSKHAFAPDGLQQNYLMGMSGDLTDAVKFEVQPV
jgi:hypothetical protein